MTGGGGGVAVLLDGRQRALVEQGLPLVERVAASLRRRYAGLVDADELGALGRAGLVAAARAFDPSRGTPFDTYAWSYVHGAMKSAVRVEAQHRALAAAARRGVYAVLGSLDDDADVLRDGDDEHRARAQGAADALAAGVMASIAGHVASLHGEELAVALESHLVALRELDAAMTALPERDRRLLTMVYRDGLDIAQAAATIGLSYATARRVHRSALDRLAALLRARGVHGAPAGVG
jgi:RNA polymerase sigma factor for flagellar operon FliA